MSKRTRDYLRAQGFIVADCEKKIPYTFISKDAFGIADFIAAKTEGTDQGCWLIQATSGTNHAARVTKIRGIPESRTWLQAGGRIAVISWKEEGPRGQPKVWMARFEE